MARPIRLSPLAQVTGVKKKGTQKTDRPVYLGFGKSQSDNNNGERKRVC